MFRGGGGTWGGMGHPGEDKAFWEAGGVLREEGGVLGRTECSREEGVMGREGVSQGCGASGEDRVFGGAEGIRGGGGIPGSPEPSLLAPAISSASVTRQTGQALWRVCGNGGIRGCVGVQDAGKCTHVCGCVHACMCAGVGYGHVCCMSGYGFACACG